MDNAYFPWEDKEIKTKSEISLDIGKQYIKKKKDSWFDLESFLFTLLIISLMFLSNLITVWLSPRYGFNYSDFMDVAATTFPNIFFGFVLGFSTMYYLVKKYWYMEKGEWKIRR